ncbi:uncharacterized protein LOC121991442 [Zingiber officinale]|uniref:Uncharacterized protein n=1 Tax=Zingiber officinale TaxID=94328 RepID=A0A8J5G7A4_ZINOF|nr:uncharacterized protein LOC121991442 [Zingiber officinale]KAG6497668.1 hypothetical protein ZIOFF_045572 [Zingiber officinale]
MDPSLAKRVSDVIRAAFCMIRKGFSKHCRLIVELHLLLRRGKLSGKAIGKLLLHHQHHPAEDDAAGFPVDPARLSFYRREDVEFSCSSTPSPAAAAFFLSKRRPGQRRGDCAAAVLAKEFEELMRAAPSPSAEASLFGQSSAGERLRIADSPFPATDEEEAGGGPVDWEAEAFIMWFREQLRLQRSLPATPECRGKAPA